MDKNESNILLFDGVCNLCNNTVYFIIRRDKRAKFRFASIQSDAGQSLIRRIGLPPGNPGFLVYLLDNRLFIKSSAVLQILRELGGGWQLFYGLIIIPGFIRDLVYNFIAKHRYRLFGKRETCMIPSAEFRDRFLD